MILGQEQFKESSFVIDRYDFTQPQIKNRSYYASGFTILIVTTLHYIHRLHKKCGYKRKNQREPGPM